MSSANPFPFPFLSNGGEVKTVPSVYPISFVRLPFPLAKPLDYWLLHPFSKGTVVQNPTGQMTNRLRNCNHAPPFRGNSKTIPNGFTIKLLRS